MLGRMPKMCSTKSKMKNMVNETEFDEFLSRVSKTLYYGDELVDDEHLSFPVIELAAEIYSDLKTGKSIDKLYLNEATEMIQHVRLDPCLLVLALLYIERLRDCNSSYLEDVAPSQLFLISLVLASKFHADNEYELSLSFFPNFADWTRSEIFVAELSFLSALDWNTHVSPREFQTKLKSLERHLAAKHVTRRHWVTYTEMSVLLNAEWLSAQVTQLLITVSAVCLASYTAGVLILLASTTLASHISATAAVSLSRMLPVSTDLARYSSVSVDTILDESVEEEIDSLVSMLDENRIGDIIERLRDLGALPAGYGGLSSGTLGQGGGLEGLDGRKNRWDLNCGKDHDWNLNRGKDHDWNLNSPKEASVLHSLLTEPQSKCIPLKQPNVMYTCCRLLEDNIAGLSEVSSKFRSPFPNGTYPKKDFVDTFCLDNIIRRLESRSNLSTTYDSFDNIPLPVPRTYDAIPMITSALASILQLSLFDYFPPLNNVSIFSFDGIGVYDTCVHCDAFEEKNRYFRPIDRNGYRLWNEKIDLKF